MNDKYRKIADMRRPVYPEFPPMSRDDRAAQFSPFAALTGYEDEVKEASRLTSPRTDLGDDAALALDDKLRLLRKLAGNRPVVKITYFVPDSRKSGGSYEVKEGTVRRIDDYENLIVFEDKTSVKISRITGMEICDAPQDSDC